VMNGVTTVASKIQDYFNATITQEQTRVTAYQAQVTDQTTLMNSANQNLNGNPATGTPGLLTARDQLKSQALVNLPTVIADYNTKLQTANNDQAAFNQQLKNVGIARTMSCFQTQKLAGETCTPGGPPVSYEDLIVCRVQQSAMLGANGTVERDATTTQNANQKSQSLSTILSSIVGNSANIGTIANTQDQRTQAAAQSVTIQSPADVQRIYGSELSQYSIGGVSVLTYVMQALTWCQGQANTQMAIESANPDSALGQRQVQITQENRDLSAAESTSLQNYVQLYDQVTRSLSPGGSGASLDVSACTSGTPQVILNCITDMQNRLNGLLNGSAFAPQVTYNMAGTMSTGSVTCRGLNQCIEQLQLFSQGKQNNINKINATQKAEVAQVNTNMKNMAYSGLSQVNATMAMAQTEVGQLNAALSNLGVAASIAPKNIPREQWQTDPNTGILQQPNNVLGVLGGTPLWDMTQDPFGAARQALADSNSQYQQTESTVMMEMGQLNAVDCNSMALASQLGSVNSIFSGVDNVNCANSSYCDQENGNFDSTMNIMNSASNELLRVPGQKAMSGSMMMNMGSMGMGMGMMGGGYGSYGMMSGYGPYMGGQGGNSTLSPNITGTLSSGMASFCQNKGTEAPDLKTKEGKQAQAETESACARALSAARSTRGISKFGGSSSSGGLGAGAGY